MTTEPLIFAENIHRVDYLTPYAEPQADADSFIDWGLRPVESLDGPWHFAIDPYDTCLRSRWFEEKYVDEAGRPYPMDFSFDDWETVPVPSCWNTLAEKWFWYEGSAVYVRKLEFQPGPAGERVFLSFGAAAHNAYVFLNGDFLGWHQGASTPFRFEVTGKLKDDNRLVVVVNNTRRPENVPMDNTDWFNYGGLHRGVALVRVPATFIKTVSVTLVPNGEFRTVAVRLSVEGLDIDGRAEVEIPELGFNRVFDVAGGVGSEEFDLEPELWSPDNPKLYDVYLRYDGDEWHDHIGFREIAVNGLDILLNGKPLFLRGVSQHEESVANGRSLTKQEVWQNLTLAKELGCTFMRLAHYPHDGLVSRMADEVGMLLWEEIPVYWAIQFEKPEVLADADNQLRELILRDRNRASVIIWSVGNENPDTDDRLRFMSTLVDSCHDLDPTRPVSAACLCDPSIPAIRDRLADKLDIIGINEYYGWYEPDFTKLSALFENSQPTKPVIITEFGADAVTGLRGAADERFTEDYQLSVYQRQIEVLSTIPYVKGTTPWIFYDFRCPRRTSVLQGYYNRKGLLNADKTQRKLAFGALQEWYKSMQ
ncbi:MAG: hypothetical protein LBV00_06730 [Propionibacteriaceae bacterium]|jgi:beta-glucuronidase|nr:hypothetical protein [Propionibacteriaceae bacterium]